MMKKGNLTRCDKAAQTVGVYCLLLPLRSIPLPSVAKDPFITFILYDNAQKVKCFSQKPGEKTENQSVPSTVINRVPGSTVTSPVSGFSVTVAAGTVISKLPPVGKVKRPFS